MNSNEDLALLASVFSQLGDTLSTIITKRELLDRKNNDNKPMKDANQKDGND